MYHTDYKSSSLWRSAFPSQEGNSPSVEIADKKRLITAHDRFREKAQVLAAEIGRDLPTLTDHSVHHLDALWILAGEIAGSEFTISPLEAFVLGGAILLHDLANSIAAYPNRLDDLKGPEWDDHIVASYILKEGRRPTSSELTDPNKAACADAVFGRLRDVHASASQRLATQGFVRFDAPNERIYLIEDDELRDGYGDLIGRIASSHHWDIHRVEAEFASYTISGAAWHGWEVDALKLACILRCADAAHLDMHRASTLLMTLRTPSGESENHWKFQNLLHPPKISDAGELEYRSTKPFGIQNREAWWLAYDMISTWTDDAIRSSNRVLNRNSRSKFCASGVAGADNPEVFSRYLKTEGWEPVDISVRITDVASVIDRFGGHQLYGADASAPVRELIANAADATRARRHVPEGGLEPLQGNIVVRIGENQSQFWFEIEDEGIGMSEDVLRGPLLDFGSSFWSSRLAARQYPGLISSEFRPTGKFGIGFFSVFMLGSHVKVTTRRFDAARLETKVLEIARGFRHPLLRRPDATAKDETSPRGGTKVRVLLFKNPWSREGPFGDTFLKDREEVVSPENRLSRLSEFVARIAPALDVDLWVEISDGNRPPTRDHVSRATDWKTLEFDALLNRIGGSRQHSKVSDYICEPTRDGQLLARMRLLEGTWMPLIRQTMLIGGFSAKWESPYFEGVILGEHPRLNRSEGQMALTSSELTNELKKAVTHGFLPNHPSSPDLAKFILSYGVVPEGLSCFVTPDEELTINELQDLASRVGVDDELLLIEDDAFEYEDELGMSTDHQLFDRAAWLSFNVDFLILATGKPGSRWKNWDPLSDIPQDWTTEAGIPISLFHLAVFTICSAWKVNLDELDWVVESRTVAMLELRDGTSKNVELNCLCLTRH